MSKRVTSWRGPSPHHWAQTTQHILKKCRSGGEPLATLSDLTSLRFEPQTSRSRDEPLPLDQLAGYFVLDIRLRGLIGSAIAFVVIISSVTLCGMGSVWYKRHTNTGVAL